jgi:mannose-6-phosphate isomerase
MRGHTLHDVMTESGEQLLGRAFATQRTHPGTESSRFPLLVKWIDAHENLSIQVHPPDGHPRLPIGEGGKTECWFIAAAEPGAEIYLGLRRGIDRAAFIHELNRGTVDRCLNAFPARRGDFYFVPAGTPHAIGSGVLLAEIQQTSDVTFRLFDWNRVDPATGRPRDLQIEPALECIQFRTQSPVTTSVATDPGNRVIALLRHDQCRHFKVDWRRLSTADKTGNPGRATAIVCVSGGGRLHGGAESVAFRAGDCALVPATGEFICDPAPVCEFLEAEIGN